MGAPGVEAQQKLEQQPTSHSFSSSQQHVETGSGQQQQSGLSGTFNQQASENANEQHQTKS